jgi:hypothetical protein
MASRQAVLLTPLESSHLRPLPSSHLINPVHRAFSRKQPFCFHAIAECPSRNSFLLIFMHFDGGCRGAHPSSHTPFKPNALRLRPFLHASSSPKPFRSNTYTISHKCSFQRTYSNANSFRINTYEKEGGHILQTKSFPFLAPLRRSDIQVCNVPTRRAIRKTISSAQRRCGEGRRPFRKRGWRN